MRTSSTAELFDTTDEMYSVLYIKAVLNDVNIYIDLQLTAYSTILASLSTSIKELQERLSNIELSVKREAFNEGGLGAVH